jgi:integrase
VQQCCVTSLSRKWAYLRHFLEYASGTNFYDLEKIDETFPNYLESARNDNKPKRLSPVTIRRNLLEIKDFYKWAMLYKPKKYKKVTSVWLDTFKISKARMNRAGLPDIEYFSQEETQKLCALNSASLIDQRDRATVALLYVSAMRISAITSLRINAMDIDSMTIFQRPSDGVHTKNGKEMRTVLLPIKDLISLIREWKTIIENSVGHNGLWYAVLSTDGLRFADQTMVGSVESRNKSLRDGVKRLCYRAGLPYRSPHKFRRGHGVYAVKHSRNLEQFQAYSKNMGHDDPGTTFKYYSQLSHNDIKDVILKRKV